MTRSDGVKDASQQKPSNRSMHTDTTVTAKLLAVVRCRHHPTPAAMCWRSHSQGCSAQPSGPHRLWKHPQEAPSASSACQAPEAPAMRPKGPQCGRDAISGAR